MGKLYFLYFRYHFEVVGSSPLFSSLRWLFFAAHLLYIGHGKNWYHIVQYGTILYNMVPYCTIWYHIVQYGTILYNMIPYCTIWYHIVQYAIWYHICFFRGLCIKDAQQKITTEIYTLSLHDALPIFLRHFTEQNNKMHILVRIFAPARHTHRRK